jgi:hypothetical protein
LAPFFDGRAVLASRDGIRPVDDAFDEGDL